MRSQPRPRWRSVRVNVDALVVVFVVVFVVVVVVVCLTGTQALSKYQLVFAHGGFHVESRDINGIFSPAEGQPGPPGASRVRSPVSGCPGPLPASARRL